MEIISKKNKLKAVAVVLCTVIASGTLTYVDYGENSIKIQAKTVSDIEAEKAENQNEIDSIQKTIDGLKNDIDQQEAYQKQLQEKIDLQNKNIDYVNTIINDLNVKIEEKENKINQLEIDIAKKQTDIDKGLELFKDRLRAMYISGNDSLASALVGATDFYDMLSKIELISQVAKHDDELIDSLTTQLEQYKEAQAQLNNQKKSLDNDLTAQQANREELRAAREQLQADYEESSDYITRKQADMASYQRDIDDLKKDNDAMDNEIQKIEDEIERQRKEAIKLDNERQTEAIGNGSLNDDDVYYSNDDNNYSSSDDDNNDYTEDNNDSSDYSETSGSTGGGGGLSWPVPGFYGISSGYGYRWGTNHNGIDIAGGGISGAAVTAAASGTVIVASNGCSHNYGKDGSCGCGGGYGNYVVIDHGNGISTLYGHCASINVSVGQSVSGGQTIGYVGSTGWSTGFHCHFEVRVNGSAVDPQSYV